MKEREREGGGANEKRSNAMKEETRGRRDDSRRWRKNAP